VTARRCLAVLLVLGGAGVAACATKADVQQIQADVALFKAESGRRDSVRAAQLAEVIRMQQVILDSLRTSGRAVSRLKGDLASDLYNIQQQLVQLQELTGQSQQAVSRLRTQLEARQEQMQTVAPSDAATPAPAGGPTANQMYDASLAQLQRGSNATARAGLQDMLRTYPTSERVPDALYFIGQSFAAENADSVVAYYQQVVDRHPASPRAASALYNLGTMAERSKDAAKARERYRQVVDKYPQSPEADLARDKLKVPGR
jgi:tol-pal system protein YbgF